MSDAKLEKRPVDYSAGTIILSLVPGDERVALVLNKKSVEVQVVPKEFLKKRRYRDSLVEECETDAIVSFIQPDGFGSPFGKEEPEDGRDRKITAAREGEEETGSPVRDRIFQDVSYTEQPNYWSAYFNIVFLANGVGFSFRKEAMCDPFVDPRYSAMWKLRRLPIPRRRWNERDDQHEKRSSRKRMPVPLEKGIGIYQAALRRIIAILLQLRREHLEELGRPGAENAEDLAGVVVKQIPYRNFFSHRMLKMLSSLGRLDIAVGRLKEDKGVIYNPELAAQMASNLILWLPYKPNDAEGLLNQALQTLVERCDPRIRSGIGQFMVDRLERREKAYLVSLDKQEGLADSDEKIVVVEEDDEPEDNKDNKLNERDRQFAEAIREKAEDEQ